MRKSTVDAAPVGGPFSKYLNARETAILIALIKPVAPKVFIEFGCNVGLTARRVLDNVPSIDTYIGIDVPPYHVPTLDCQWGEVPADAGWWVASEQKFHLLIADRVLTRDDLEPADAVFIDGDHSFDGVMRDARLARALVRPGGLIAFHDYGNPHVEVTAALDHLEQEGWPLNQIEGSWIAYVSA